MVCVVAVSHFTDRHIDFVGRMYPLPKSWGLAYPFVQAWCSTRGGAEVPKKHEAFTRGPKFHRLGRWHGIAQGHMHVNMQGRRGEACGSSGRFQYDWPGQMCTRQVYGHSRRLHVSSGFVVHLI